MRVGGLTVGALQNIAENRHVITSDGELLDVTLATDDDLVIWSIVTQRLRTLARNIEQGVNAELADRVRRTGGAITTPAGKASETISRGSVSGSNHVTVSMSSPTTFSRAARRSPRRRRSRAERRREVTTRAFGLPGR